MMHVSKIGVLLGLLALFSSPLMADDEAAAGTIEQRLNQVVPGLTVSRVQSVDAPGLYEVTFTNGETVYATEDGEYLITGDMLQATDQGIVNVTEAARAGRNREILADYDSDKVIRYAADDEQARIAVFTDIDCPYCRKFHDDVPRLNELGITVDYYAFPRSGPGTASATKYESVWCAADQQQAMDEAKSGGSPQARDCDNPVNEQFELGRKVGVTGTPAIFVEDGYVIRGYVPADRLARQLGVE